MSLYFLLIFLLALVGAFSEAPDEFVVELFCSVGKISVEFKKEYAPLGVQRIYDLVNAGYYDRNTFFRVVPNFVVQYGLAGDPGVSQAWSHQRLQDDPVKLSNEKGVVSFAAAGPASRTTQLFFNLKDNSFLDNQGFAGLGRIIKGEELLNDIYADYGERPQQGEIIKRGNEYLEKEFPELDYIIEARVLPNSSSNSPQIQESTSEWKWIVIMVVATAVALYKLLQGRPNTVKRYF